MLASDDVSASFSGPQNNIMLFDKATLAATRTMSGHTDAVTSLKSVEVLAGTNRRGLISCGRDGRIRYAVLARCRMRS